MSDATRANLENGLLAAAQREIKIAWRQFNRDYFKGALREPSFDWHEGASRLGLWFGASRTVSLARDLALKEPWYRVLAVLKHEMTHQYIEEVLGAAEASPHGPLFERICREKEIESLAEVGLVPAAQAAGARAVEKVRKLLALASSSNRHEAEAAMQTAHRLMLEWNVREIERHAAAGYVIRHLGEPGRINAVQRMLATLLRDFFFVETVFVDSYDARQQRSGRVLEVLGRPENVEIAEYTWHFLLNTAATHWRNFEDRQPGARRLHYMYGLVHGFYDRLQEERARPGSPCTDLVWQGDPDLERYFRKRYPRLSWSSSSLALQRGSFEAGRRQGRKVVLHQPLSSGFAGTTRARLPPGAG